MNRYPKEERYYLQKQFTLSWSYVVVCGRELTQGLIQRTRGFKIVDFDCGLLCILLSENTSISKGTDRSTCQPPLYSLNNVLSLFLIFAILVYHGQPSSILYHAEWPQDLCKIYKCLRSAQPHALWIHEVVVPLTEATITLVVLTKTVHQNIAV